jgi:hypothetical protein
MFSYLAVKLLIQDLTCFVALMVLYESSIIEIVMEARENISGTHMLVLIDKLLHGYEIWKNKLFLIHIFN